MTPRDPIRMSAPDLNEGDEELVLQVLRSGVLSLGPYAVQLERAASEVAGVSHGVAVSSGTAGLHLIVRALGIGPGDDVLVPSFTFAASANVLLLEGARPVFVDIEPETYNLDPHELRARRTAATKAVVVVDIFGHPADWDGIREAAPDLLTIDDSCEAIGARYKERPVGGFGSAGVFAFYPNKQMTTGEGGAVVTNDDELAAAARSLRNQGREAVGAWLEHTRLGFNYRMDEMSAALGVSQISRLQTLLAKRARVASLYDQMLAGLEWARTPLVRAEIDMSWFVYVITLAEGIDRDLVMARMGEQGIPSRAYFPPLHLQPYIRDLMGDMRGELPVTESVAPRTLALPFHGNLTLDEIERVVESLELAVSAGS